MRSVLIGLTVAGTAVFTGCNTYHGQASREAAVVVGSRQPIAGPGERVSFMPSGVIYRTNGNYNDNVAVTLSPDRKNLVSFPAPTDVSDKSAPIPLADGFLLDRRGITANSAFLRYTYAEYAALRNTPSPQDLLKAVIPGAMVTEIVSLPMTLQKAMADTAAVNRLIESHSDQLEETYKVPRIVLR